MEIDSKLVLKYLDAIKTELDSIKAEDKGFFTQKLKTRLLSTIEKAVAEEKTPTTDISFAIAVDNIVRTLKGLSELDKNSKLVFVVDKLDKLTLPWISEVYGKSTSFDRTNLDKDIEKAEKKKEVEEKTTTDKYLKLLKDIGTAITNAEQEYYNYNFKDADKKSEARVDLAKLEKSLKTIKTELDDSPIKDDSGKEKLKSLLTKVYKVKQTFEPTIFSDAAERITKKIASFAGSLVESEEVDVGLILEFVTRSSIIEKLDRLHSLVKGDKLEAELVKIIKTLKMAIKDNASDVILSQIEAFEDVMSKVKTTIKTEIKAIIKEIESNVGGEKSEKSEKSLTEAAKAKGKRISISYETWDEDALDAGETDDKGWKDEEGVDFSDDPDESPVADAVKFLKKAGAVYPSASHFGKGIWYSDEGDTNVRTGEKTIKSYHLNGEWTTDEQKKIFDAITKKKSITESYYNNINYLLD